MHQERRAARVMRGMVQRRQISTPFTTAVVTQMVRVLQIHRCRTLRIYQRRTVAYQERIVRGIVARVWMEVNVVVRVI